MSTTHSEALSRIASETALAPDSRIPLPSKLNNNNKKRKQQQLFKFRSICTENRFLHSPMFSILNEPIDSYSVTSNCVNMLTVHVYKTIIDEFFVLFVKNKSMFCIFNLLHFNSHLLSKNVNILATQLSL